MHDRHVMKGNRCPVSFAALSPCPLCCRHLVPDPSEQGRAQVAYSEPYINTICCWSNKASANPNAAASRTSTGLTELCCPADHRMRCSAILSWPAALTLQDVVEARWGIGVGAAGNAVELLLQAPSIPQQPHLQLRHCHTLICMAAAYVTRALVPRHCTLGHTHAHHQCCAALA